jgi:hypothetical protein
MWVTPTDGETFLRIRVQTLSSSVELLLRKCSVGARLDSKRGVNALLFLSCYVGCLSRGERWIDGYRANLVQAHALLVDGGHHD